MKKKKNIIMVGNFTIDVFNNDNEKIGGSPIYSGFAVYMLGGIPHVVSSISNAYENILPPFLSKYKIFNSNNMTTFKLIYKENGKRDLLLVSMSERKLSIENHKSDGLIINPVCNEIDVNILSNISFPSAVDIQGFVRICEENKYVILGNQFKLPYNRNYLVVHANYDELSKSMYTVSDLITTGFKEVLVSYDEDGFITFTRNSSYKFKPENIGPYKTGTGDVLLASYFMYRLNGIDPEKSTYLAGKFTEWFSNSGYRLLSDIG
ncbi:hypothetical protein [Sulfolobus acidocaldarius]|uniref:Conserved Archaeal protein n=4 Tax=Sulfolobus acidocaldarius TaxID=2285 RepID=Q4JAQ8_SULAC|nr:hypothetical protein [Sulfolobus acidocaldarius]AAY80121.1 conserved Archaeal protein [Sulfolobus acidocaldarius DSM 639]AGE70696.1 hypothetical protein SacN8_03620 [Sulfolobus acidocaldarius N8]AGE72968.1 hypothetical protein SacRon12I_03605 [Sulfolobus acidocaldarius Ron12/I]ALU28964.1 hypothetical protein ATY89_02685 [Sulfolobus acidocaldarius]ALU31691.1 hypothetical protein ATZ20_05710 [Sulfolobus acidocaldarius]